MGVFGTSPLHGINAMQPRIWGAKHGAQSYALVMQPPIWGVRLGAQS